ncbi:hypothetical protein A3D11_03490 [Candidatus Peribacteria bacterium RIFCSPHIGHO2_02_FULL_49_16]|nr:MAG: hypothetical protein A2880_04450 [Candidatus Peribacteria bacterium RIFCSPHIGHO2_01_FULL_49_38]OGJ58798.1 MAG: hypothetical protein A3D11_03490 [Candidatus Peribacteria bacterium RIFCSPHIGHO2_02_FULL_49_16]
MSFLSQIIVLRSSLSASDRQREDIWMRVREKISPSHARAVLQTSRETCIPADAIFRIWIHVVACLKQKKHSSSLWFFPKWVVAIILVAIVIRSSPLLFFASETTAGSSVFIFPTSGTTYVFGESGGWEPLGKQLVLDNNREFRTGPDGELTIVFHDDGVVRLAPSTRVHVRDLSNRPQDTIGEPSLVLLEGTIWVQGLLPYGVEPLSIQTALSTIFVQEGSISVTENSLTEVSVWNRRAEIVYEQRKLSLVAGERIQIWQDNVPYVTPMQPREYALAWIEQNLERDAVHRQEVAAWQKEQRIAMAGILPTSPLYRVKRAAEAVDTLLTFDEETRVKKQLNQAEMRLNEALALLENGNEEVYFPLKEYEEAVLAVAGYIDQDIFAQELLRSSLAEDAAAIGAVLPDDDLYLLKQAILEAGASIHQDDAEKQDIDEVFLLDRLAALSENAYDPEKLEKHFTELEPALALISQNRLSLPARREAHMLLSRTSVLLDEHGDGSAIQKKILGVLLSYLPRKSAELPPLTEEELEEFVKDVHYRVFVTYTLPRSRRNQLLEELRHIEGHRDEGRILRRMYLEFPEGSELLRVIRFAIQELRRKQIDLAS